MSHRVLDIRTYALVPGSGATFDRLFREHSLPLLESFDIATVAYGLSLENDERFGLIRSFTSPEDRDDKLDSFYDSSAWAERRSLVLPLIESYHTVLIPTATPSFEALWVS